MNYFFKLKIENQTAYIRVIQVKPKAGPNMALVSNRFKQPLISTPSPEKEMKLESLGHSRYTF